MELITNRTSDTISIVTVSDNDYAILLAALLKSIEINHKSGEKINFYIVEDNISETNKTKIENSIKSPLIILKWLKMSEVISSDINLPLDNSSFPLNVYVRLFIPYFIPSDLEKVIYLDVDMIVLRDISELWKTDIAGKIVAGVVDRSEVVSSDWGGIKNYREHNLSANTKYFNSGLLIIVPSEWKRLNIPAEIIKCVEENKLYAGFPDQYGLNVVLANRWFELDRRWNTYSISDEINPFIIHFIDRKPIYNSYSYNKQYRKIFFEYLQLTEWSDFKSAGETRRIIKKFYNKLEKRVLRLVQII